MNEPTFKLRIDGQVVSVNGQSSFTAREVDELVKTARFATRKRPSGARIDVEREVD